MLRRFKSFRTSTSSSERGIVSIEVTIAFILFLLIGISAQWIMFQRGYTQEMLDYAVEQTLRFAVLTAPERMPLPIQGENDPLESDEDYERRLLEYEQQASIFRQGAVLDHKQTVEAKLQENIERYVIATTKDGQMVFDAKTKQDATVTYPQGPASKTDPTLVDQYERGKEITIDVHVEIPNRWCTSQMCILPNTTAKSKKSMIIESQ